MCGWEGKGGKPGSGIPHGKAAQIQPREAGDPEPKREAGRPWSGSGPSPDFPSGWGRRDSLPPPSLVSLFAFLLLATWRRVQPSLPLSRHGGCDWGIHPKALPTPWGFGPEPEPTDVVPGRDSISGWSCLFPYAHPYSKASARSPPPRPVPGRGRGGQRRGCDSSRPDQCQLQLRLNALCQLALTSGTETEARSS